MVDRYILPSVCLRFSQLSFMQYMGQCVFSLLISLLMIVRTRVLYLIITIKLEVWTICLCLGLGHETMACIICLSIFLYGLNQSHDKSFCLWFKGLNFTFHHQTIRVDWFASWGIKIVPYILAWAVIQDQMLAIWAGHEWHCTEYHMIYNIGLTHHSVG